MDPMLIKDGFLRFTSDVSNQDKEELRGQIFRSGQVGTRCLLDEPVVGRVALHLKHRLVVAGVLLDCAVAVQAIAFDKTPEVNWKVTWHQDLMFPFGGPVTSPGYSLPSIKGGIHFARPPRAVLEELLAVRLHLDDSTLTNGPLRVALGSHNRGLIPHMEIAAAVSHFGETICEAPEGTAWLMRPLLLHASSPASNPSHRRVLHLVYHSGFSAREPWHRALG